MSGPRLNLLTHTLIHSTFLLFAVQPTSENKRKSKSTDDTVTQEMNQERKRNEYGKMIVLLLFVWKMIASLNEAGENE